jgi:GDP-mannose 6-dehydrogenase
MKISIFGLGYVGCVTAACLAKDNHKVIGVDVNPMKVDLLRSGRSPVVEPGLDEIICEVVQNGRLQVSVDSEAAVHQSDVSLICVGTPSNENGSLKVDYVENVCREIGMALSTKKNYHLVVIRSTVLPGTVEEKLIPLLEEYSGLKASRDFGVCMNPEFLREGSAINDYFNPSLIVVGELDQRSGDIMQALYSPLSVPVTRTNIRVAEMVKYTSNAYHALKVVFANEIGNLSKANGIDGQEVMDIFIQDHLLNISPSYLNPGFAFGGSCLPKDLRAILYRAKELDVECPLLGAVLLSNQKQVEYGIRLIEKTGSKKIGILGLSFKADTDDLRESPMITLAETLLGRGYQISIYDEKLNLSKLVGANKLYLEKELPHIASLMCSSIEQLLSQSQVVVITNSSKNFRSVPKLMHSGQTIIDLVGIAKNVDGTQAEYEGICW